MDRLPAGEPVTFFGTPVPPGFERREIVVPPGGRRVYDAAEWQDAIAVVEQGEIELSGLGGVRHRFRRGDMLWLTDWPLRALYNPGTAPAVLVAVSRRRTDA